jgi:hypothetical protein
MFGLVVVVGILPFVFVAVQEFKGWPLIIKSVLQPEVLNCSGGKLLGGSLLALLPVSEVNVSFGVLKVLCERQRLWGRSDLERGNVLKPECLRSHRTGAPKFKLV